MTLTTPQRIAIRAIHDGKGDSVARGTFSALERRKLVSQRSQDGVRTLTDAGERAYADIMSSGDGPEALKARFSFLGGGGRR